MKRSIWIKKASNFKIAEIFDADYYSQMSSTERLETMQFLRDLHHKFIGGQGNANRKRLRRVVKVIQQK